MEPITYLRQGRKLRATGTVVSILHGAMKVKPSRDSWGHVWVTPEEVAAGAVKPPVKHREKNPDAPVIHRRKRDPKPIPVPRWKQLVEKVRADTRKQIACFGCLDPQSEISEALADELESAHQQLSQYLPL